MKKLSLLIAIVLPVFAVAQECHLYATIKEGSNCVLKLAYIDYTNGAYNVTLTNKQDCNASIQLHWQGRDSMLTLAGYESKTFPLQGALTPDIISAKALTDCIGSSCFNDCWVDVIPYQPILAVHFKKVETQRIDKRTVKVLFTVDNSDGIKYYNIKVSPDAINWKTVKVLIPATKTTATFSTTIKM